jgi:hypothetical protein
VAIEAYIPSSVEFEARSIPDVYVITLHNPDTPAASGSMTTSSPLPAGEEGRLRFKGTRDGKEWQIDLERISVHNRSALGCEFSLCGPVQREVLRDLGGDKGPHEKGFEEQFDIR